MEFLHLKFLGNEWLAWLSAFLTFMVVFFGLRTAKQTLIRRIGAVSEQTTTNLDDLAVGLLKCTKTYSIAAISFFAGVQALSIPAQADLMISKSLILFLLIQSSIWGSSAITFWIERYMKKRASEDLAVATTVGLISFMAKLLLYSTIVLLALSNFGINITALVAGLGVGGIAVALAAQNILGDLFASLTIVLDKPFIVGDFIIVGEFLGTIEHIGLKTTRLRSLSGEQLIFSNADLLQSRIRNYKRMNERRVVFSVRVTHQTPIEKLKCIPQIIRQTIERNSMVRFDRSHFNAISEFALNIETVFWVKSPDYNVYMDVQQEFNLEILRQFREEGIQFAYPTQSVFLDHHRRADVRAQAESSWTVPHVSRESTMEKQ